MKVLLTLLIPLSPTIVLCRAKDETNRSLLKTLSDQVSLRKHHLKMIIVCDQPLIKTGFVNTKE